MELLLAICIWIVVIIISLWLAKELFIATFSCIKTEKINERLFAVKTNFMNFYIYKAEEATICFDAGYREKAIIKEMEKISIKPEEVTHVFLTHSDIDHVGGLNLFKNALIFLSVDEEQMITGKTRRFPFTKNKPIKEYQLLKDGEEVKLGETVVKGIATPGHTPGSMSYLVNEEILFTGDTVFIKGGKIGPFYRMINMDTKMQKESIKKI
ncbi:MAG: MBL fold metallo-hydrolase, partial [Candidatus Heimdallarchaeota archaeon]|nr:MBL fold metallo-hydrolase [Candidatus Heimdallarchaeota archaeon]MCK5049892.1 MBL fold metallo-hydrolase [Candidatus Heimdallarchaeota archaeon]